MSTFKPEHLIINRPELVAPGQKFTAWGITLLFWGALLYLWQPLLSLLAWGLNIGLFYNHMILLGGYHTFLQLLLFYFAVIAALGGSLILWARINQWRFRGRERRRGIDCTDTARLCASHGIALEQLIEASASRVVRVLFDAEGGIAALQPVPVAVSERLTVELELDPSPFPQVSA